MKNDLKSWDKRVVCWGEVIIKCFAFGKGIVNLTDIYSTEVLYENSLLEYFMLSFNGTLDIHNIGI